MIEVEMMTLISAKKHCKRRGPIFEMVIVIYRNDKSLIVEMMSLI